MLLFPTKFNNWLGKKIPSLASLFEGGAEVWPEELPAHLAGGISLAPLEIQQPSLTRGPEGRWESGSSVEACYRPGDVAWLSLAGGQVPTKLLYHSLSSAVQETDCSSVGAPQGHKPCQQTCSGVDSSLHGSAGPGRSPLQHRLPMGSQLPSRIHLPRRGVPSTGYRWISAPPWTSMGCRGTACLTMVFSTGCIRGISAPVFGAPPPPPSTLTLVSAAFSLLSPAGKWPYAGFFLSFFFFPCLTMLPQRCYTVADGLGLDQQWVCLAAGWCWLHQT